MPRRPSPNPPGPGDQIRISFLLDRRREPELAYIFDMEGHGDRPRELLRLAQIGYRAEIEMRELHAAARAAQLASLSTATVGDVGLRAPSVAAAPAPQDPQPPTKSIEAPLEPAPVDQERAVAPAEPKQAHPSRAKAVEHQPEVPAAQGDERSDDAPVQKITNLGFLA